MFVEAAIRKLHGAWPSPEATLLDGGWGTSTLILTGQLGDVMKESARAATTYAATHALSFDIRPTGSVRSRSTCTSRPGRSPRTGRPPGVAMATAIISAMSGRPVRRDVADDRRDHAPRPRSADRRRQGEGPGRPPGRLHPASSCPKENEADLDDLPEPTFARLSRSTASQPRRSPRTSPLSTPAFSGAAVGDPLMRAGTRQDDGASPTDGLPSERSSKEVSDESHPQPSHWAAEGGLARVAWSGSRDRCGEG